jgi:hypothetical protein
LANEIDAATNVKPGPTIPVEHMPENMRVRATEINAYMREMPRLLAEGEEGRFVLFGGAQVFSTWDTFSDAIEAGYERFGLDGQFLVQRVLPRDYERFLILVDNPYMGPG